MSGAIQDLQRAASDSNQSVSDLLRRALVVATKLGLADFGAWVRCELHGYPQGSELPAYRHISGFPMALNPMRGWVPIGTEDASSRSEISRAKVPTPLAELESLLGDKRGEIVLRWPGPLAERFAHQNPLLTEPVTKVSRAAIVAVLEAVRNEILDWALKLEAESITGNGLEFTDQERSKVQAKQQVTNYFGPTNISHVTASGDHATVNVTFGGSDLSAITELAKSVRAASARLDLQREALAELKAEMATLEAQAESPKPKSDMIRSGLTSLVRILGTAAAKEAAGPLMRRAAELLHSLH